MKRIEVTEGLRNLSTGRGEGEFVKGARANLPPGRRAVTVTDCDLVLKQFLTVGDSEIIARRPPCSPETWERCNTSGRCTAQCLQHSGGRNLALSNKRQS